MTGHVRVRAARQEDARPHAALYRDNRDHLAPFEPARDEAFFTEAGQVLSQGFIDWPHDRV